ncbi:MAG: RNA polymerase sigma-70 factor [Bacteroidota bacterium]
MPSILNDSVNERTKFLEQVYYEKFDRLYAYAVSITHTEDLAKDVVSEVFYHLLDSGSDLKEVEFLDSYLFTCIKNEAIKVVSKSPSKFSLQDREYWELSVDKVNPEELMFGKELEDFIEKTLDSLPDVCALVFRLSREKGLRYAEVSEELGISVNTVKHHMKCALKKIRQALDEHFDDNTTIHWMTGSAVSTWILLMLSLS